MEQPLETTPPPPKEGKEPPGKGEALVDLLLDKGMVALQSPKFPDRKFYLTLRREHLKDDFRHPLVRSDNVFKGSTWDGVTDVAVIDLFEEIPLSTGEKIILPIGNRDFRIADFGKEKIAYGIKASRTSEIRRRGWPLSYEESYKYFFEDPFSLADGMWTSGITVFSKEGFDEERGFFGKANKIRQFIPEIKKHFGDKEPWTGKGFGKLLQGLGILVLKKMGITELHFGGTGSYALAHIVKELGHKGEIRQPLDTFDFNKAEEWIAPFEARPVSSL